MTTAMMAAVRPWRNYRLDDTNPGGPVGASPRSWIMLMPEGKYEHPQYGELNFTHAKLAEFKQHFDQRTRKIDIAFDEDHNAGKATGWLKRVELRPATATTPAGLWGEVEWTTLGQHLLMDRIYGYFSPEFGDYQDEQSGRIFHNVIIGGALTNRPYLKVMPAVTLAEVSRKSWASINKSELPRSCFLVKGSPDDKSTWKLPIYEGAGPKDAGGHYTQRGALNINGVRAAIAAIGGARTGSPMSVPGGLRARLEGMLKRYGSGGGGAASDKAASEGGRMGNRKAADTSKPLDPEWVDNERLDDLDTDGKDETMDDGEDGDGFDSDSNTHGPANTDGHMHGKYGSHSHDGDADHSDAPLKASSRKASSKKASESYATGRESQSEMRLREEVRELRFKLYEGEVGKTLEGWNQQQFQYTEGGKSKGGRITTSKVFDDAYRAYMLNEGLRLSEQGRQTLNSLIEKALSTAIVDLSERGSSFDQESRRTVKHGGSSSSSMRFDEGDALEDEAEKIALSEYHKPVAKLSREQMFEVYERAASSTGYKSQFKI